MVKTIKLKASITSNGLRLSYGKKKYDLAYPPRIWSAYPRDSKKILVDNLAYLLTINVPLVSEFRKVIYNISKPFFEKQFKSMVLNSIPCATHDYDQHTKEFIDRFLSTKVVFRDDKVKKPVYKGELWENSIVPLSCGKDSLLTLAVAKEAGMNPIAVYIIDTVSPSENRIKIKHAKKLCKEQGIKLVFLKNSIEQLNDFETWDTPETCLGYTHMITGFCFISLPLLHYFKSNKIIIGNQKDMDFHFINKEDILTWPAPDQNSRATKEQHKMIKKMSGGRAGVYSIIRPLTNIAITKILHHRYPEFAKYQVSCDCLDACDEERWCHDCNKGARLSLFTHAVGRHPRIVGFKKEMLDKKHEKHYALFNGREVDHYELSAEARDQQLLAFLMAHRAGVKGYLIDKFKKEHLKEAKARERELRKKFFKVYGARLPREYKKEIVGIYKEEMKELV
ncbi:hypothetical protein KY348_03955 [Candidatus Woesearchaeota archaeon]|nr:hypothetical protein [Candidatus Woesearchaeota archaeon]